MLVTAQHAAKTEVSTRGRESAVIVPAIVPSAVLWVFAQLSGVGRVE